MGYLDDLFMDPSGEPPADLYDPYGYAIAQAYGVDDALSLACVECGAEEGKWCVGRRRPGEESRVKKSPHSSRLVRAYRQNNPVGRRRVEEREARGY